MKQLTDNFLCAKFHNEESTFFVENPDQKFFLFQNLLVCIHSCSSPHSIWSPPWLVWYTLFVKLHSDTFLSAYLDIDMSIFFVENQIKKSFRFRTYWYAYTHTLALIPFERTFDYSEIRFSGNCTATVFWAQTLATTWAHFSQKTRSKIPSV